MYNSKITGLGYYLPENVVTNDDLSKIMDTTDEWIQERIGIKRSGLNKEDIDFIIFATLSPDMYFPGGGVRVQDMLGMPTIGALDVRNQCSGFIYSLSVADQFIKTGMYKNILVIGSENHSGGLEKSTRGRGVTVIFGDGAGAAVVSVSDDDSRGILSSHLHSEGKHARELMLDGPNTGRWVPEILEDNDPNDESYYPYMNGQFVFKNAVVRFSEVINEGLKANELEKDDIDLLIPHQANLRIAQFIQRKFQLSDEKVYNNIMNYGNTTAASIIIALAEAWEQGKIKDNDLVVLAAFGAGFTWGSVIIRW